MRAPRRAWLLVALSCASCSKGNAAAPDLDAAPGGRDAGLPCTRLFGLPNDLTGLGPAQCAPECVCDGKRFVPPAYGESFIQSLVDDFRLSTPYGPLTADPYASPAPAPAPAGTVCGVLLLEPAGTAPWSYELVTYPSEDAALAAGAHVTHFGACGVCSTLENLAVYMRNTDLAGPVRACGLQGVSQGEAANLACLQALGFDLPCAEAWYYDTVHTRTACLDTCLSTLNDPYHLPDGALNPCIQCDEDESGPIFQAVAGRTRRNSGLPNALCRPCSQVQPLVHEYGAVAPPAPP